MVLVLGTNLPDMVDAAKGTVFTLRIELLVDFDFVFANKAYFYVPNVHITPFVEWRNVPYTYVAKKSYEHFVTILVLHVKRWRKKGQNERPER